MGINRHNWAYLVLPMRTQGHRRAHLAVLPMRTQGHRRAHLAVLMRTNGYLRAHLGLPMTDSLLARPMSASNCCRTHRALAVAWKCKGVHCASAEQMGMLPIPLQVSARKSSPK